MKEFA